eukprot:TRINITY_DN24407_c0_g2_i1.p1 TRINITY_DN24407_c0_g2~~TRINITY_DN24407_c0_g2_i1.p1  ORF type:complete len:804 (-),score=123.80 TRINITY_DN24407_c0_g2_i1:105-2516(-)
MGNNAPQGQKAVVDAGGQKAPTYSFARLQQLYDRLSQFRESDLDRPGGGDAVVETVRQITEALIWGEQNDEVFFDFFCEKSILADFIRVLGLPRSPKSVRVQLLQTLSMLVQNIRTQTSLYYLLSNNYINRLILMNLDFSDEEILAYYITLLKSLAMQLKAETIMFFFSQQPETVFPLYTESTKFFSHRDQMVRANVRTITLQVYGIEEPTMREFVLRHASEVYFSQLAQHLRELWLRLGAALARASEQDMGSAQHENELQQDILIYVSDILDLKWAELNNVLADRLLKGAILPVLLAGAAAALPGGDSGYPGSDRSSLTQYQGPNGMLPSRVTPTVALFLLRQVMETCRCTQILTPLACLLFQPAVPRSVISMLPETVAGRFTQKPSGDMVPNQFKEHFLEYLRGEHHGDFIYMASVIYSCVRNKDLFPSGSLESAGLLPRTASSAFGDRSAEVLRMLLEALQNQAHWQMDTFPVLCRVILELFLDPALAHNQQVQGAVRTLLNSTLQAAAQRLRSCVDGGSKDDAVLDALLEEWELHRAPPVSIGDACGSLKRLFPSDHSAARRSVTARRPSSASNPVALAAQTAARCFFVLRRTVSDLQKHGPAVTRERANSGVQAPWHCWSAEKMPFGISEEAASLTFREGDSFEIGLMDRVVCSVVAPQGKQMRYLLLHDYWLILAQPDLSMPGWVIVKTLWPLRQVQPLIDRGDPRTLLVSMQGFRGGAHPGDAAPLHNPCGILPPPPSDERPSLFYTLALVFEDVKRCHSADVHLQRKRQELRGLMLQRAAAFVGRCCVQQPPLSV